MHIIGKGTPGATLELSLSKSPFTNILPSDVIVNSSGEIDYTVKGYINGGANANPVYNELTTQPEPNSPNAFYFRLSKNGQTSPIKSWSFLNYIECYNNNPAQNTATGIKSFQSTLKAANEYCVNQLGISATQLPTSWP